MTLSTCFTDFNCIVFNVTYLTDSCLAVKSDKSYFTGGKSDLCHSVFLCHELCSCARATNELTALAPDLIVVVAYGKILPQYVLDFPKHGCINVHGSLLPEYRGAAPMQRAIIDGKKETGVTTMQMAAGLDTGDMLARESLTFTEENKGEAEAALADIRSEKKK